MRKYYFLIIGIIIIFLGVGCDLNPTSYNNDFDLPGQPPSVVEKEMLDAVNVERKTHGLSELEWCGGLGDCAQAHSNDMYDRQYFNHWNPENEGPSDRGRLGHAGSYEFNSIIPPFNFIGENIAHGYPDVKAVMEVWMNSQHHQDNILSPNYTHIGIGYCEKSEGKSIDRIWTQNFATRNPDVIIITSR